MPPHANLSQFLQHKVNQSFTTSHSITSLTRCLSITRHTSFPLLSLTHQFSFEVHQPLLIHNPSLSKTHYVKEIHVYLSHGDSSRELELRIINVRSSAFMTGLPCWTSCTILNVIYELTWATLGSKLFIIINITAAACLVLAGYSSIG